MQTINALSVASHHLNHLTAGLAYADLRIRWAVVRARVHGLNPDDEFRGLYISEEQVDALLGSEIGQSLWPSPNGSMPELKEWPIAVEEARGSWLQTIFSERSPSSHLQHLIREFQLTPEEIDLLLLTLAPEFDPRYERLFAYLQDDVTKKRPSVNLLLDLLTDSFQEKLSLQALLSHDRPLMAQKILTWIDGKSQQEPTLLAQYVKPASSVSAYLLGQETIDPYLADVAHLIDTQEPQAITLLAHLPVARLLATLDHTPLIGLTGAYGSGKQTLAYQLGHLTARPLLAVDAQALEQSELGLADGLARVKRDGRLHRAILYISHWDTLLRDDGPPASLMDTLLTYPYPIIVTGEKVWQPRHRRTGRPIIQLTLSAPDHQNRLQLWQSYFEANEVDCAAVATHFRFTPGQIRDAATTARDLALWHQEPIGATHLLQASRMHSNQKLSALATKITPRYTWSDIVLPEDSLAQLREMVATMQQQSIVYESWGFGDKLAIGKGLKVLFAGEPGTGKTMSADILAYELGLDLYKIDLSTVVDKYIGETEKNIGRIFDEAATSNAILFFDEADSLFGKRSEVKDSHDRHANIQTGYLLQRMEAFDGVVILATNLRSNIDEAFTRRLHFVVEFPFPEVEDRERIWRVTFPEQTPRAADVDFRLLAERFRLAGGNIRNIVLAAAFLAAEQHEPIGLAHLMHASRREYQKMGRLINEKLFAV